jgi:hypothetical protein
MLAVELEAGAWHVRAVPDCAGERQHPRRRSVLSAVRVLASACIVAVRGQEIKEACPDEIAWVEPGLDSAAADTLKHVAGTWKDSDGLW